MTSTLREPDNKKYPDTPKHAIYIIIAPTTPLASSCFLRLFSALTFRYTELCCRSSATTDRKTTPNKEKTKQHDAPAKMWSAKLGTVRRSWDKASVYILDIDSHVVLFFLGIAFSLCTLSDGTLSSSSELTLLYPSELLVLCRSATIRSSPLSPK